jgi:hypothetical protein
MITVPIFTIDEGKSVMRINLCPNSSIQISSNADYE